MPELKIGSLFSGYEGLGRAVQSVMGGDIAWVSDIDPGACKILAHRYPDVPNIGDIERVGLEYSDEEWAEIKAAQKFHGAEYEMPAPDWSGIEPVDILTGGSPCQDVSAAGKRKGMRAGTRSGLWASMCDAIDIIRPSLVVWENVRGVLSAGADSAVEPCPICVGDERESHLRALGRVVGDLSELGYVGRWVGLRAADVGAPHGRFRVFLTARPATHAEGDGRHEGRAEPARLERRPDVALGGSAPAADRSDDGWKRARRARYGRYGPADRGDGPVADTSSNPRGVEYGNGGPAADAHGHAVRLESVAQSGSGGAPVTGHPGVEWGIYEPAIRRWERLTRPAPLPFMANRNGDPQLAPAFAEWMQGLPAGWVTDVPGLTRNEMLKALGNGVVWQQAAQALRMLLPDVAEVAA